MILFPYGDARVRTTDVWRIRSHIRRAVCLLVNSLRMVRKGSSSKPKNSNTASTPRRAPAAAATGGPDTVLQAGPVQVLKGREEVATVQLDDTYPLQSETDPFIGGTVQAEASDELPDISSLTEKPSEYSELPDCYIVDPPETLPEEIFDISDLLQTPGPETPPCYVQPYVVVAERPVDSPLQEKVVNTNSSFDTGLVDANLRENGVTANDQGRRNAAAAPNLEDKENCERGSDISNKKVPKRKKKGEETSQVNKKAKVAPRKKNDKKAVPPKGEVETKSSASVGAAPSPASPLPSRAPPPVADKSTSPERRRSASPLIGLTRQVWPHRAGIDRGGDRPNPQPERIFYCKGSRSVAILVYGPPHPVGVSKFIY